MWTEHIYFSAVLSLIRLKEQSGKTEKTRVESWGTATQGDHAGAGAGVEEQDRIKGEIFPSTRSPWPSLTSTRTPSRSPCLLEFPSVLQGLLGARVSFLLLVAIFWLWVHYDWSLFQTGW